MFSGKGTVKNHNRIIGKYSPMGTIKQYYYGARFYAAWTCRFISVDPLASDYVHLTPYNNAGNKPINSVDIDGLQGSEEQVTSPDTLQKSSNEPGNKIQNIEYDINAADNILPTIPDDLKPTLDDQLRGDWTHPRTGEQFIYSNDDKGWAIRLPEINVIANVKEINNQLNTDKNNSAEKRGELAREYEGQFKYSLGREKGTTNCADFVAMIMVQTDSEIAEHFTNQNGNSSVKLILNAIKKLNGTIRKENPQVGDLALWYNSDTGKGHVEFVSSANGKLFTTFGAGSGIVPREMGKSKNGFQWLSTDYSKIGSLGNGGVFLGFWTPHK